MNKVLVFLVAILISFNSEAQNEKKVLVELFTSQGCSSCPSADRLLEELVASGDENLIVLSYHVDYWNRLGWKDPFSLEESTQRQYAYSSIFRSTSVYTPQAVVNGSVEFVGSNRQKMLGSINSALESSDIFSIPITTITKKQSVEVSYEGKLDNEILYFMLVQKKATTQVRRGENGGRTLSHVNVVREIIKTDIEKKAEIQLPVDLDSEFSIIALLENKRGKILAVGESELK